MKTLLTSLFLLFFIQAASSQNIKLNFKNLDNSKKDVHMTATSADYLAEKPVSSGRASGKLSEKYVIQRKIDGNSSKINDAFIGSKLISKLTITIKNANGSSTKHILSPVSISNYRQFYNNNKNHTEEFILVFQNRTLE